MGLQAKTDVPRGAWLVMHGATTTTGSLFPSRTPCRCSHPLELDFFKIFDWKEERFRKICCRNVI